LNFQKRKLPKKDILMADISHSKIILEYNFPKGNFPKKEILMADISHPKIISS